MNKEDKGMKKYISVIEIFYGFLLMILILVVITSCTTVSHQEQTAQETPEITPPVPKEPVTNLLNPEPPSLAPVQGKAVVPEGVTLGFSFDLNGIIPTEDWKVAGTIKTVEPGMLTIITDTGEQAHLAYRLPEGMDFTLEPDQTVSLIRTSEVFGAALDYRVELTTRSGSVLISTSRHSVRPIELDIWKGLTLRQSAEIGEMKSQGKYETTYMVPVEFLTERYQESLESGRVYKLDFEGRVLELVITSSEQIIPSKGYEGVLEGSGYFLECVLIIHD